MGRRPAARRGTVEKGCGSSARCATVGPNSPRVEPFLQEQVRERENERKKKQTGMQNQWNACNFDKKKMSFTVGESKGEATLIMNG
jgi:hypothetical protein